MYFHLQASPALEYVPTSLPSSHKRGGVCDHDNDETAVRLCCCSSIECMVCVCVCVFWHERLWPCGAWWNNGLVEPWLGGTLAWWNNGLVEPWLGGTMAW